MSKEQKIKSFNPNDVGQKNNNIFGLPFTVEEAEIVILPIPWEVTVSYSAGTANGPESVFEASQQIDLYDPYFENAWKIGVAMDKISDKLKSKSELLRKKAVKYIDLLAEGETCSKNKNMEKIRLEINENCKIMNEWVYSQSLKYINKNKLVVGLGGDHSTPLGLFKALSEKHESFAILQIDAHADLRHAYEGFEFSHASIMFNALKIKNVSKLVQVGIRDYCEEEINLINNSKGRVKTYFDKDIKHQIFGGKTIKQIHQDIVKQLPKNVFVSFDIDGLDPKMCPNTGTPVPGGFEFEEALHLIQMVADSGKKIIGLDLNEVSPGNGDWNANVGGRLLYRMINIMAKSNGFKQK